MKRSTPSRPPATSEEPLLTSDSDWEDLRILLREANRPEVPSPEYLQALRERALRRFAAEPPSLWELFKERLAFWTDGFSARSSAARVLQLAVAGAVGAVAALWIAKGSLTMAPSGTPLAPGIPIERVNTSIVERPGGPLPGSVGEKNTLLAEPTLGTGGPSLAQLAAATPVTSPGGKIDKSVQSVSPTTPPLEGREGGTTESPGTFLLASPPGQAPSHPLYPENVEGLLGPQPVSVGGLVPSTKDAVASRNPEDTVLEEMEKLRFKLIINGDRQYQADVNKIQAALVEAMKGRPGHTGESAQMKTLRLLRQAETALAEKRYVEAINAYNQVAIEVPGGMWEFMARYLIANIEFENLDQFNSALDEYRLCLEKFPAHFISDDKLNLIRTRVELLSQTSENNWEPLRLFTLAQKSGLLVSQQNLLELLEKYPESRLAGQAAQKLADLAASDLEGKYVDPDRVLQTLQRALNLNPSSSQAAAIQFAIADILQQRLFKPGLAVTAFQRVLQLNPTPELAAAANSRLQELNLVRFATPTP